jgi:mono/diheme cytochrome c family protein
MRIYLSHSACNWALSVFLLASASVHAAGSADVTHARMIAECTGVAYEDCIVRKFKDAPEAAVIRGKIAYQSYCVLCHGAGGQGDGRAARIHNPKPANLTLSRAPPEYLSMLIRKGGEAMGRSPAMPPWGEQLTDEQVRDTIQYLLTIRKNTH